MVIQLLSNSFLYLIPNFPLSILIFAHLYGLSENIGVEAQHYFNYLCDFVILLFPFVCLSYLSELRKKIQWKELLLLRWSQQTAMIAPQWTTNKWYNDDLLYIDFFYLHCIFIQCCFSFQINWRKDIDLW